MEAKDKVPQELTSSNSVESDGGKKQKKKDKNQKKAKKEKKSTRTEKDASSIEEISAVPPTAQVLDTEKEQEMQPIKRISISITVSQAKNLVSSKGDSAPLNSFVKIQFLNEQVAESETIKDNKSPTFNCTKQIEKDFNDELVDEILNNPLNVIIVEGTGNKGTPLGIATIDLASLVENNKIAGWFPVITENFSQNQISSLGEVEVVVELSENLIPASDQPFVNVLTLNVDSAFSLPPKWAIPVASEIFQYNLQIKIPSKLKNEQEIIFSNGILIFPKEENNNNEGPTIKWGYSIKKFFGRENYQNIKDGIESSSITSFPLEFTRKLKTPYESEEKNIKKYEGKGNIEVNVLREPGTQSFNGKYYISSNGHFKAKGTEQSGKIPNDEDPDPPILNLDPNTSLAINKSSSLNNKDSPSNDQKSTKKSNILPSSDKNQKASKKPAPQVSKVSTSKKQNKDLINQVIDSETNEVENPFDHYQSYITLSGSFSKPLIYKPLTPRTIMKVSDFIPKRSPLPKYLQLKEASSEFQDQIKSTVHMLANLYKELFKSEINEMKDPSKKKKFLYELNHSGKYFAMKEKIKKSVVRIVKEKFAKTAFGNKEEMEGFISDLYVFLNDQVHTVLNAVITEQTEPKKDPGRISKENEESVDQLLKFANELETAADYKLANKYHQERVALFKHDSTIWFEYALFSLRIKDIACAEECLREAISIDIHHLKSLIIYGALLLQNQEFQKSEAFLTEAIVVDSNNLIANALLAQVREQMETEDSFETSKKANQLYVDQKLEEKETIEIYLVEYLLENHLTILADQTLQKQINSFGKNQKYLKLHSKILLQKGINLDEATSTIHEMLRFFSQDPDAWTIAADFYFLKNSREAIETYSHALSIYEEQKTQSAHVMIRLGQLYQKHGRFASAKNMYLKVCQLFPSAFTWMSVGIACYSMGDLQEAQDALAEANMLNPRDARVWAYISLLSFRSRNILEAQQAFREAIKFDLSDSSLLMDLGEHQLMHGQLVAAETCFRLGLKHSEPISDLKISIHASITPRLTKLLGDCLFAQDKVQEAASLYQKLVNTPQVSQDLKEFAQQQLERVLQRNL